MSETNTQNNYEQDVDQALAIAATASETQQPQQEAQVIAFPEQAAAQQPVAEQANVLPSDFEHVIAENDIEPTTTERKAGKIALMLAAGAMLAGSFVGAFSGDKEQAEPEGPVGVSETSAPYQLGSESVKGNAIDTTSEAALLVTENIPGEQGGLDLVAQDIDNRTAAEASSADNLNNIVYVPENADVNSEQPGVQLVETSNK